MSKTKSCPKCSGSMVEGFVLDQGYGHVSIPNWREGEPKKSFWHGGVKLAGTTPIEISTWRCKRCGFLENFAE